MLTQQDIENQLKGVVNAFYSANYDGELPTDLIEKFRIAIMEVSPMSHQIQGAEILEIAKKRIDELTILQVGRIINVLVTVPPSKLHDTLEDAFAFNSKLEKIMQSHNLMVANFEKKLAKQKTSLETIGGVNNSVPFTLVKGNA
jgi:TusA-related sulfurtransferase